MNLPSGVPLPFNSTFALPDLPVAMTVLDTTDDDDPTIVQGPTAIPNVIYNTYEGKFTANPFRSYLVVIAVYTDDTFTTLSDDYYQASTSFDTYPGAGGSGAGCDTLVGYIVDDPVVGFIEC